MRAHACVHMHGDICLCRQFAHAQHLHMRMHGNMHLHLHVCMCPFRSWGGRASAHTSCGSRARRTTVCTTPTSRISLYLTHHDEHVSERRVEPGGRPDHSAGYQLHGLAVDPLDDGEIGESACKLLPTTPSQGHASPPSRGRCLPPTVWVPGSHTSSEPGSLRDDYSHPPTTGTRGAHGRHTGS